MLINFNKTAFIAILTLFILTPTYATEHTITIGAGETQTTPQILDGSPKTEIVIEAATPDMGETPAVAAGMLTTTSKAITALVDDAVITNNGVIETTGDFVAGIFSEGDNAIITNSGTIEVMGDVRSASGIYSSGADAIITNSGTIEAMGDVASGITSSGADAIITNSGAIRATGDRNSVGIFNSFGIFSEGDNAIITNSGTIEVMGNFDASGIYSSGADAIITNSGTIRATGDRNSVGIFNSFGVFSEGDNAIITNSGTIEAGNFANGIVSEGDNAIITNSGTIEVMGNVEASGIYSSGANAIITNSGTIEAMGNFASGIVSGGDNAIITNSGTIRATGVDAIGIYSSGADAIITNSGTIEAMGNVDASGGIYSLGADATIINSGTIRTTGAEVDGIYSEGDNAKITNSGTIMTTSAEGSGGGIASSGADAIITNSGTIMTTGAGTYGIGSSGTDAIITNSGTIVTSGSQTSGAVAAAASGIASLGADAIITNSGTIRATGDRNIFGIISSGDNAIITNSGTIEVMGNVDAIGIYSLGADATITNSGSIFVTGDNSYAIRGGDNNITLNLLSDSMIIGEIDLGGGMNTVNVGTSTSAVITFGDVDANIDIRLMPGVAGVVNGNMAVIADQSGEASAGVALAAVSHRIHTVINRQITQQPTFKPIKVASSALSVGALFQRRQPLAWAQGFGGQRNHSSNGNISGYEQEYYGVTFGYAQDYNDSRIGLIGAFATSKTDSAHKFENETDSYFVGAYASHNLKACTITATLLGGYNDHDNERLVVDNRNGFEVADADFNSWLFSPSIAVSSIYALKNIELRPSVNVNYTFAWLDDYQESGGTRANLSVKSRVVRALNARAQLATAYILNKQSEVEVRVGVQSRHQDDQDSKANLGRSASNFNFKSTNDDNIIGGYAGLNLHYAISDDFNISADIEYGDGDGESHIDGQLSLEYKL